MSGEQVPAGGDTLPPEAVLEQVSTVLARARDLERRCDPSNPQLQGAAARLRASVIRPLSGALAKLSHGPDPSAAADGGGASRPSEPPGSSADLHVLLWELARDTTKLGATPGRPAEVLEAIAALQSIACELAPAEGTCSAPERLAELKEIQANLPCAIESQTNGPYLVTNVEKLTDWLGQRLPTRPQMALCRCGRSATKPFCDGTHAETGFTSEKDPKRVHDRRDTYRGQQVTILDNRGTCQHSGYCTNRLATVFRLSTEPFVAPSGGRMDEIIRAVRDCPSGALSYAIGAQEAREQVDHCNEYDAMIEVSKDGPYRITGAIKLRDGDGQDEQRNDGASLEHYALCRCGHSQNKPFCSGMHWYVDFKDPLPNPESEPTIFEWAGGLPALTRMTRIFYEKYVPQDERLAPLFANMSPDHPERVAKWLAEVFCGPKQYSEQYGGYARMISQHIGKELTEERRARWVALMLRSGQEAGLPSDPEFRSSFTSYIEWGSRLALENSQPGARPPEQMPMPHWDWNTASGPPGSRLLALEPTAEEDQPVSLPGPNEAVSFEAHIKPLFRHRDRQSMKFAFDLWSFDDVKQHAHAIQERLHAGSMPCDGSWPQEKIHAFDRWVTTGMSQ